MNRGIETEPIGSLPRPQGLTELFRSFEAGQASREQLEAAVDAAVTDTIRRFEDTGSPVVTDGEQGKPSFLTYPFERLTNVTPPAFSLPLGRKPEAGGEFSLKFADGHERWLPRLVGKPFRFGKFASDELRRARQKTSLPVKQAVISTSALSLLYPKGGIDGYPREQFLSDLVVEAERDIRLCLEAGAHRVQIDFTEARYAIKLDPSLRLLDELILLNNLLLERFTAPERARIGVHTCPGGDLDSQHSADVDYALLLPFLFRLDVGQFYIQLASEKDPERVLRLVRASASREHKIFVGVIDPISSIVETPEVVRDRVLQAARFLPPENLGTTDDCGFAPFADDASTSRDLAFAKIKARVEGTRMAERILGG